MDKRIEILRRMKELEKAFEELVDVTDWEKKNMRKGFVIGKLELMHKLLFRLRLEFETTCVVDLGMSSKEVYEE